MGKAGRLLESVNEVFIPKSLSLMSARKKALRGLSEYLAESGALIFRERMDQPQSIQVFYSIKGLNSGEREEGHRFRKKVEESGFLEQSAGSCLYGAHRDDFQLFFQGKDSRYFCSQGQQRALLISLKTAQVLWFHHIQKSPCLLLLDDVFSEIDKHIVCNLLHFLEEIPSQAILTSTAINSLFNRKRFQVFNIKKGVLRKDFISGKRDQIARSPSL